MVSCWMLMINNVVLSALRHVSSYPRSKSTWEYTTSRSHISVTTPAVRLPSARSATWSVMREFIQERSHSSASTAPKSLQVGQTSCNMYRSTLKKTFELASIAFSLSVAKSTCTRAAWRSIISSIILNITRKYMVLRLKIFAAKMRQFKRIKTKQKKTLFPPEFFVNVDDQLNQWTSTIIKWLALILPRSSVSVIQ